ncbi:MAG: fumarylacetoacetate hydrolase, partial [Hyphomicrobiaceae bacterium]|nr:fumarylacetoacetate hydrolase [Hyphomicrobiaceae bacterium]
MLGKMTGTATLPHDVELAALAGRVWRPELNGPSVVAIRADGVFDISQAAATMSALCEQPDPAAFLRGCAGERIGELADVLSNTPEATRDRRKPWLLAPCDLHAVKAAGVTFARSLLERVIEEQAKGAPEKANAIRASVETLLGGDLRRLKPGSKEALALKETLIAAGAWSQYLEVGIGEDAEIFTKAQPMSAVGHGMDAGLHPRSTWNNRSLR